MNKIRVLHLELSNRIGGIEKFLFNLYKEIDKNKVQFDFATTTLNTAPLEKKLINLGGNVYHIHAYKNIKLYYKDIEKLICNGEYDVIHIHKNSATNIIPFIVIKRNNIKSVIVHSHNTRHSVGNMTKFVHFINIKYLYKNAKVHLACSTEAGKWLYGNRKYEVIYNGIDINDFAFNNKKRINIRKSLGIEDSDFVVGNIGRFEKQKNHKRILEIFNEIVKIDQNAKLILVGDGYLKNEIIKLIEKLGLQKNVILTGVVDNVNEIVSAIDCFLMPSLYEGLPIAAIEAQISGASIALSDTISPETDIFNKAVWFSLNDKDKDIARKIVKNKIKDRAIDRSKVLKFDVKYTANKILNIYSNLIENRSNII